MGTYLLIVVVGVCLVAVWGALDARLRKRHPDIYRRMVEDVIVENVATTRFRLGLLWRFLASRSHKALNDPTLSLLCDIVLVGWSVFIIALVGGLIWIFGSAFRQIV